MTLQINTPSGARDLTSEEQVAARAGLAAAAAADLSAHVSSTSNPHSVTKAQVGLGNVDNTADSAKPVSTAQAEAIGAAVSAIPLADGSTPGLMAPAQVTKLAGLTQVSVINDLTTGGASAALSAEQGKTLKTQVDGKATTAQGTKADSALQPGAQLTQAAVTAATAAGVALLGAADATAQRTALGLGTAATTAATAYATAAQGTKADAAMPNTAGAMAATLEGAATTAPADLARIQASVSDGAKPTFGSVVTALAVITGLTEHAIYDMVARRSDGAALRNGDEIGALKWSGYANGDGPGGTVGYHTHTAYVQCMTSEDWRLSTSSLGGNTGLGNGAYLIFSITLKGNYEAEQVALFDPDTGKFTTLKGLVSGNKFETGKTGDVTALRVGTKPAVTPTNPSTSEVNTYNYDAYFQRFRTTNQTSQTACFGTYNCGTGFSIGYNNGNSAALKWYLVMQDSGRVGIGMAGAAPNPSALLEIGAGTATIAPVKFTSGVLTTTPQSMAFETDGTNLFFTNAAGVRKQLTLV